MTASPPPIQRLRAGGALEEEDLYIRRPADDDLLRALRERRFCYVLAPRQIGKSSVCMHVLRRLAGQVRCGAVDVTSFGDQNSTADAWYFGLLQELSSALGLDVDVADFVSKYQAATPVHRFSLFLKKEVLARIEGPVVIFIDEIDSVRSLPFSSDDFFAAVRAMYNARARDPELRRLTFCLLGVASPGDLIQDGARTPFNVGEAIRLEDFTREEAQGFLPALADVGGAPLLDAILQWTDGHPYMTQVLSTALRRDPPRSGESAEARLARLVQERFLRGGTVVEPLHTTQARLDQSANKLAMLRLYVSILDRERVEVREDDPVQADLRLCGLVREREERPGERSLVVRNRIFATIFDRAWARSRLLLAATPAEPDRTAGDYRVRSLSRSITVLRISGLQAGPGRSFGGLVPTNWDELTGLVGDEAIRLRRDHGLVPDLICVTGGLTATGKQEEFADAQRLLVALADGFSLGSERVLPLPGVSDMDLMAGAIPPLEAAEPDTGSYPLWPLLRGYARCVEGFHRGRAGYRFTSTCPWTLFEVPALRVVVAALDSLLLCSPRDGDKIGGLGEKQLHWFADRLAPYRKRGWLRIGLVHHCIDRLRDGSALVRILGEHLNLLLDGPSAGEAFGFMGPIVPTLSAPAATEQMSGAVPWQMVRVFSNRVVFGGRWPGVQPSPTGWLREELVSFESVSTTFGPDAPATTGDKPETDDLDMLTGREDSDQLFERVLAASQLRAAARGQTISIVRHRGPAPFVHHAAISLAEDGARHVLGLAATEDRVTLDLIDAFHSRVHRRYNSPGGRTHSVLVWAGPPPAGELIRAAHRREVRLISLAEHEQIIDFTSYLRQQTTRLETDLVYPPSLYVAQRLQLDPEGGDAVAADALALLTDWLCSPEGRFVLVLGDFGTGKTFLLHELARRLGRERLEGDRQGVTPVLIELRQLEKAQTLDALLAQHLSLAGMERIDLPAFRHMLAQGLVALLFDGFDELALRVSYDRAADHLDTLIQAAGGRARVVVTSRSQHFESDRQVKTALARRLDILHDYQVVHLLPFGQDQILHFLMNRLGEERAAQTRFKLMQDIEDLLGLSANPRMLAFLADIPEQDLQVARRRTGWISAASLYELLIGRWLDHEYLRAHPRGIQPGLSREQRWSAITRLALSLWHKTERSLHLKDLPQEVAAVLEDMAQHQLDLAVATHQVGSGTLLVHDGKGSFSFIHQSILEYLVARQAAVDLERGVASIVESREMSSLMAEFFIGCAGRAAALAWSRQALRAKVGETAKANGLLLLQRLGESVQEPINLRGGDLRGRDLAAQDLAGADLSRALLDGARLTGARLMGSSLKAASLRGADLDSADLREANLTNSDLTGAGLLGANLRGADLSGARLRRAKLLGAQLDAACMDGCDLTGAAIVANGAPVPEVGGAMPVSTLAWSADGELLACNAGGMIRLLDATSGSEICRLRGHERNVRSVAFSPGGRLLASSGDDQTVRLWEVHTGRELRMLNSPRSQVLSVRFSPNGQLLACGAANGTVRLWEVDTGRELRILQGHSIWVRSVGFSPDGCLLASCGDDKTVRLWEVHTGRELFILHGHSGRVRSVGFGPDGRLLASAGDDQTVRLWEVQTGNPVRILRGHGSRVRAVEFGPDGRLLASAGDDQTVRLWQVHTGYELHILRGHSGWVRTVRFSPDGHLLASGGDDRTVRLWEIETSRSLRIIQGHGTRDHCVGFSPDGCLLASAGDDQTVRLWEVQAGRELRILRGHSSQVLSVRFSPNGHLLASAGADRTVRLWEVDTGHELRILQGHSGRVRSVGFSPDGRLLASAGDDQTVRLWEVDTGRDVRIAQGHSSPVFSVRFSPNGHLLASAGADRTVRLWEVDTGRDVHILTGHRGLVRSVEFSPNGHLLASSGDDQAVLLWDVVTGRVLSRLEGDSGWLASVGFSPDGSLLAVGGENHSVTLWEIKTGRQLRILRGHGGWVRSVEFSPDGRLLASAGEDSTIKIWHAGTGECLATMASLPEGWATFRPSGRYKVGGQVRGGFWHSINLCRFEPGELDPYVPGLRMDEEASIIDLPPAKG